MFDLPRSTRLTARRIGISLALIGWMSWIALPVYSRTGPQSSSPAQDDLTLEDRINYQRRIEDVYWRHRIWPKENPQAKPDLDEVMPLSAIRAKVEDYLSKSWALEAYWHRPITGEQLQAEMDRMARQTKQPAMLRELWAALGNDPYVVAECLARSSLVNRLIRNWYAHDERYHGELKTRADADLRAHGTAGQMRQMSGEYHEMTWVKQEGPGDSTPGDSVILRAAKNPAMKLSPDEWETKVRQLAQVFGAGAIDESPLQLPIGELSRLQEDDDRFYVTAVLDKGNKQIKLATVEWRKQPFDAWWNGQEAGTAHASAIQQPRYAYRLAEIASGCGTCMDDTWTPTLAAVPSARNSPNAVWTGSEMIVWGGTDGANDFNTGGRYDPATDSWTATSATNAPVARDSHTAVWTGSKMIVWGGASCCPPTYFNTGGRYDPASDTWTPTNTINAPSERVSHTAVWTGSEMIVWGGGNNAGDTNTGGRYNPDTDTWTATDTSNAPSPREQHTAVWTGSEMVVWGGQFAGSFFNTGGRYDPASDTWTPTNTINAPSARDSHTVVWSGSEMIVWGGTAAGPVYFNTGGRYDPGSDTWTATDTNSAPSAREFHTAVWTGIEMIVWGGANGSVDLNTGGRYDPTTDTWAATATTNAPSARVDHTAVWTGSEMIVWGGNDSIAPFVSSGGRYDPASDTWVATATTNTPSARSNHTAVWTGSEMIVWGGSFLPTVYGAFFNTGGRYDPATDTWTPTSTTNAPSPRELHTAVWTGSAMIVWGGNTGGFGFETDTGGRYDPAADTWAPTSTSFAPSPREFHTAVWTGSAMIVWGGHFGFTFLNSGRRYNPSTDSWTDTSATNAPIARARHTAVWTGSQMIVWGGTNGTSYLATGGRYDPASDSWTLTNQTDPPSGRAFHTAVWTGSQMIVWGGTDGSVDFNTGGRYDPASDFWTPTDTSSAPGARDSHTAIWTGNEMIVWGGVPYTDTGGRYCASVE